MDTTKEDSMETIIRAKECGHVMGYGTDAVVEKLTAIYAERGLAITIQRETLPKVIPSPDCEVCS